MRCFGSRVSIQPESIRSQGQESIVDNNIDSSAEIIEDALHSSVLINRGTPKHRFIAGMKKNKSQKEKDLLFLNTRDAPKRILKQKVDSEIVCDQLKKKFEIAMTSISVLEKIIKSLQIEKQAAVDASIASNTKYIEQKSRYETAASAAADASQLATEEAKVEADSRMEIERGT